MIIDCISDLHGHYPQLEGGDLLIVAGDLTKRDTEEEMWEFHAWIEKQSYSRKVVIAGNHDNLIQKDPAIMQPFGKMFDYLCDSSTEFEYEEQYSPVDSISGITQDVLLHRKKKLKIWGSPWTKRFPGMNPKCMAFTVETDEELAQKWALIPDDVDILVTHCPPKGIFDQVPVFFKPPHNELQSWKHVGSDSLHKKTCEISPKVHCYGHIHEAHGEKKLGNTHFVNASHVNERYEPVNKPIRITL